MRNLIFFKKWMFLAGLFAFFLLLWLVLSSRYYTVLDEDFEIKANVLSYDNFYIPEEGTFGGEYLSKTKYSFDVDTIIGDNLIISNVFDVRKTNGEPIFAVNRKYSIDKYKGSHSAENAEKRREGFLFAPRNSKETFKYWHINYDQALDMKFVREDEIKGEKVYVFESNFVCDQTQDLTHLPEVGKTRGIELDASLKLWIEPYTGLLIKYEDRATAYFYDLKTKERIHPWNRFRNKFEKTSINAQIHSAKIAKEKRIWWVYFFPLSILFAIVILLFLGVKKEHSTKRPVVISSMILGLGVLLSVFSFRFLKSNDETKSEIEYNHDCEIVRRALKNEVQRILEMQLGVKNALAVTPDINAEGFNKLADFNLQSFPVLRFISWCPLISQEKKASFENKLRSEGVKDFKIYERDTLNNKASFNKRQYVPIAYIRPKLTNENVIGFDLSSLESRRNAFYKAVRTKQAVATESVILVQDSVKKAESILIYCPLFENDFDQSKTTNLKGFVSIGVNVVALIREARDRVKTETSLNLFIRDAGDRNKLIYKTKNIHSTDDEMNETLLQVANRIWKISFEKKKSKSFWLWSWEIYLLPILLLVIGATLSRLSYKVMTDNQKELAIMNAQLLDEVAERQQAEKILIAKNEEIIRSNKELDDFAYSVSHDLKAPLRGISSLSTFLMQDYEDVLDEKGKEHLKLLVGRVKRMDNFIEGILQYSRIGRSAEHYEEVDLNELLSEVIKFVSPPGNIAVSIADRFPTIHAEKTPLAQAIQNLVDNAIKYIDKENGKIFVTWAETDEDWIISIQDNGPGIPKKDFDRIFKIFQTLKSKDDEENTGIGLSIVKKVVQNHGGKIWVESEEGEGSTFHFSIPKTTK